ncbi:MAG: tRNA (adenosine(37)-N6)-threonylcarbamoyltransferase complex dimerization subunit type 1 TsaB [Propionibacteriaceae bacterium]|nr:tRNA (adenosine(37)-N6)-threonylcarbamoyltransferase complex dimerization subunit type 1 TsaB [Propionibacteriaceae bacterium]
MTEVILGIDTSTRISVGIARDGVAVAGVITGDSRSHAEMLMPTIEHIMDVTGVTMDDLSGIGVGMGPGPFTGLRVGIVAATTLGSVLTIPVYHVCSLDVLALSVLSGAENCDLGDDFIACTDARRKEVYWAQYSSCGVRKAGPFVSDPRDLPDLVCYGPGVLAYPDAGLRTDPRLVNTDLCADVLAMSIHALPDVGSQPLYLRHADATEPGSTKSVLPTEGQR